MAELPPHPPGSGHGAAVALKNLQLPFGVIAPDVWGQAKEQPALVSVHLVLNGGFASASSKDELDESTIHYGVMAKRIRSSCAEGQTAGDLGRRVESIVADLARKEGGGFAVARSTVEVDLPKASMFGDGVTFTNATTYDEMGKLLGVSRIFRVKGVKIMTVIGVNSYERTNPQPLIVDLRLHVRSDAQTTGPDTTVALLHAEQTLVEIITHTAFQTLETLADFTVTQLRKMLRDVILPAPGIQLRIEKPRAIAWADAPAVEVTRDVPLAQQSTWARNGSTAASTLLRPAQDSRPSTAMTDSRQQPTEGLSVIKPYDV